MVSRYNIYFNGRESMKQGLLQLNTNHKDDYTNILELYRYGSEDDVAGIATYMERASEKGSKVVLKHTMNFQGVEYNRWVDDSYLMIGKARFFKADYFGAIEMFDFISKRFSKSIIKYDALFWMAKTYLYSGKFQKCDVVMGMIQPVYEKNEVSKFVKQNYPILRAQYMIKTENLEEATVYLDKALQEKQNRKTTARLLFVSGQVNQRLGNDKKALEYYQACIKKNPPYIMAFHAKIFSAECYDAGSGGAENILKELNKLLKDPKNKDFYDVIYYSLANIELKKNNIPKAIEYLQLSARSSISNDYQKGISYWKLAELHFDMKKYRDSKFYYDSTLASLPKKHEEYNNIQEKSKVMTDLIESLTTIELEDSLQRLAAMSERDRLNIIDKIISELLKEEQKKLEAERLQQQAAYQQKDPNMQINMAPGSSWYFYNPSAVNFGRNEFKKIWGERKLEDLWRLQNKEASIFDESNDSTEVTDPEKADSIAKLNNPKERAYYLKNIPDTPEKIEASNKRIEKAYYKAGMVYKNDLNDFIPAADMFENLLKRFSKTEFELQSYYSLYLIYNSLKNQDKADQYKNLLISKYPESDFTKIILDPDYYKKIAEQSDEVKMTYKSIWELYQEKNYSDVITKSDQAIEKYRDPEYLPKFEYLKAISLVKTQGVDSMIVQLQHIITNYPNSEVKPLAEQLLAFVTKTDKDDEEIIVKDGIETTPEPKYLPSSDSYHLFILIVDVKTANLNSIKSLLSDHNSMNFGSQNLTISTLFLNDTRHMITVSRFNSQTDAENYFKIFMKNSPFQKTIENDFPIYFVISTDNYPVFYKDKDEQAYLDFFRKYYLIK